MELKHKTDVEYLKELYKESFDTKGDYFLFCSVLDDINQDIEWLIEDNTNK